MTHQGKLLRGNAVGQDFPFGHSVGDHIEYGVEGFKVYIRAQFVRNALRHACRGDVDAYFFRNIQKSGQLVYLGFVKTGQGLNGQVVDAVFYEPADQKLGSVGCSEQQAAQVAGFLFQPAPAVDMTGDSPNRRL